MATKDDQEAVAAFMESLGWIEHYNYWFYGEPNVLGTEPTMSKTSAVLFYQALKQREDELYERVRAMRPASADYPTGDEIVEQDINMATAVPFDDGYNEALTTYDAAINAAFGRDKEV